MNREALGFFLIIALLGGVLLLTRRPKVTSYSAPQYQSQGNIKVVPVQEPRHYHNKETRRVEYNEDGLLTFLEINRDYFIT